jgi:putative membrane protein
MAAVVRQYRPDRNIETEMETNRRFNAIEPLPSRKAIGHSSAVVTATVAPLGVGLMLWWLSTFHASVGPFWAPWEFSWAQFLSIWMTAWWYIRGLSSTASPHRPPIFRQLSFFAGMLIVYTMVQTRFEYFAEHMFFFNRLQHIGMHHVGPLLVAFSWPGDVIMRGMPASLRQLVRHRAVRACIDVVQQPVIAALLFVSLIAFWLIPSIHFRAMIDPRLFAVMNWSMVVDLHRLPSG